MVAVVVVAATGDGGGDVVVRIGSLFSGFGGLDIAVQQVLGGTVAWHVEYDAAPARILAHHWPAVPNHHDVTTVDWTTVEPVDVLTGGYPCQPFSHAGQRKGTNDERHLWPYVREAIRHLRPRYAVLENVAGHRSMGFDRVLGDLAEDGLHARWVSVRASDIGAPHHRERLFILVADAAQQSWRVVNRDDVQARGGAGRHAPPAGRGGPADTAGVGPSERHESFVGGVQATARRGGADSAEREHTVLAYPEGERLPGQQQPQRSGTERPRADVRGPLLPVFGPYTPAVARWAERFRPPPAPTEMNRNGRPRLNAAFAEWMMGLPAGHVTGVPGVTRAQQLKAIGNGVCPPQAVAALHELFEMEAA